jgi:hypothetical protein
VANFQAIAATSAALQKLLWEATDGFLTQNQVRLFQAGDFQNAMGVGVLGNDGGLSLYLYRVSFNTGQRNLYPRSHPDGRRTRPPLVIDLHYLLSAWARDAQLQQMRLAMAMVALEQRPSLPSGLLNSGVFNNVFRGEETVELIVENLSLQDLGVIWEVAKANPQPSATYLARMVALEPQDEWIEAPEVQTRVFELEKPELEKA